MKNKKKREKKSAAETAKSEPEPTTLPAVVRDDRKHSLVTTDPLQSYLAMVRKIPRITEEEEHRLAVRVSKFNDREAALKLVTSYLHLVVGISFEFHTKFQNVLDLIQEGNIGLMRAVQKFDPFKGVRLPTYATYWIKAYMLKYLLDNWRLVRVGTTNMRRKLLYNLEKVTNELKNSGLEADTKQLAAHFKTSEEEVKAVQKTLSTRDVSFDSKLSDDSERTYAEVIGDKNPSVEETLETKEISDMVKVRVAEFAKDLKPSDKAILYDRLMTDEPLTLSEIGEKHGVTREAVRQAEARLKKKLKEYLEEKIPGISNLTFQ
ncbi:MAG: sigma-70 family RNA polymerase sigma factor [Nitrospinota bacterium]|nr:sigma-70 family RNA polymerase sigma factor [Nitrospinota bacterium]